MIRNEISLDLLFNESTRIFTETRPHHLPSVIQTIILLHGVRVLHAEQVHLAASGLRHQVFVWNEVHWWRVIASSQLARNLLQLLLHVHQLLLVLELLRGRCNCTARGG